MPWFARIDSLSKEDLNKAIQKLKNIELSTHTEVQNNNFIKLKQLILDLEFIEKKIKLNKDAKSKSLNEIKAELIHYVINFKNTISDKTLKEDDFYIKQITKLFTYINDEQKLRTAIANFLKLPAETILWELNRLDIEKLGQRFIQATLTDLDNLQND